MVVPTVVQFMYNEKSENFESTVNDMKLTFNE